MSTHTISEAKERLSELIDSALAGEDVFISREGRPVVGLRALSQPGPVRAITEADLVWLAAHRIPTKRPCLDAGELVSRMRDEDSR